MALSNSRNFYLLLLLALVALVLLVQVQTVHSLEKEPHTSSYFEMIEHITDGVNYYDVLGVEQFANHSVIKRAFRKLAVTAHPDKSEDPNAGAIFARMRFAYEVLMENATRIEYNNLLVNGIPWYDRYYGKYAHAYGAPTHDIRWVFTFCWLVVTLGQYGYRWYWAHTARRQVIEYLKWKYPKESGVKKPKTKKKKAGEQEKEEPAEDPFAELKVVEPNIIDLAGIQFLLLPWTLLKLGYWYARYAIWWKLLKNEPPQADLDEEARLAAGLTVEQWQSRKQEDKQRLAKEEKMNQTNKMKQYRRFLKNRVADNYME